MPQIQLRDSLGHSLPLVNIRLSIGDQSSDDAYDDRFTDFAGNTAWPNPLGSPNGYTLYVNYQNVLDEFESFSQRVNSLEYDIPIILKRKSLDRIELNGLYLNKFIKGESAFLDYYRLLLGQDIRPLLEQSYELGSNARRNFFMTYNTAKAANLNPFNPKDFGNDFYDRIPELLDLYASYGLYLYCSIFPDNGYFNYNDSEKVSHFNRICEQLKTRSNSFAVELTNEIDAHGFNWVDRNLFTKPSGILSCSGSQGPTGNNPMDDPQWDFCDFHQPRGYASSVTDSCVANHPSRLYKSKAVGLGEPLGFGIGHNRESNPRIAKEIAGSARGTAAFIFYHTENGGFSQLYNDTEWDCGEAFFGEL